MKKTELYRCDFCHILWEGLSTDDCPKCKNHFYHLVARYPSFVEEGNESEDRENSKNKELVY